MTHLSHIFDTVDAEVIPATLVVALRNRGHTPRRTVDRQKEHTVLTHCPHRLTLRVPLARHLQLGLLHIHDRRLILTGSFVIDQNQMLVRTHKLVARRQHLCRSFPSRTSQVRIVRVLLPYKTTASGPKLEFQILGLEGHRDDDHTFVRLIDAVRYGIEQVALLGALNIQGVLLIKLRGQCLKNPQKRNLHLVRTDLLKTGTGVLFKHIHEIRRSDGGGGGFCYCCFAHWFTPF